jgi:hypothetical protein
MTTVKDDQFEDEILAVLNNRERKSNKNGDEFTGFVLIGMSSNGLNNTVYHMPAFTSIAALEMLKAQLIDDTIN